ncbi:MAG TPA: hypothetical protein VFZ96_00010 [Actinomycetota bacterium]|nr:hypothetical protein [Actinomycetota bacterium]
MQPLSLSAQKFDIGRCLIFRAPYWDGTDDLFDADMVHIGDTEGAVTPSANAEYSELTVEPTGPAVLKRYLTGEKPTFEFSISPTLAGMALLSPTGRASSGEEFRRPVAEHTLWIVPEQLFNKLNATTNVMQRVVVAHAAGAWTKDSAALTAAEQALLDMSILIWRADFSRVMPMFSPDAGGKAFSSVTVTVQLDTTKPSGCMNYLVMGELSDFPTIDFTPA